MLTEEQIAITKGLLGRGEKLQDIAAFFGENSARVAEVSIIMEQIRQGVADAKLGIYGDRPNKISRTVVERVIKTKPAPKKDLPSAAVIIQGYSAFLALRALAIAEIGIHSAREQILAMHPEAAKEKQ